MVSFKTQRERERERGEVLEKYRIFNNRLLLWKTWFINFYEPRIKNKMNFIQTYLYIHIGGTLENTRVTYITTSNIYIIYNININLSLFS